MIEIIAGVIVLILAIIGIAKLVQGRGGGGGGSKDIMKMAANSENLLEYALKQPEHLYEAVQYLQQAARAAKGQVRALSNKLQMTRGKVDTAMAKHNLPYEDQISLLYSLMELSNFTGTAAAKYRRGELKEEQFLNYVREKLETERRDFKLSYKMRHAGMA
jgi:hypothetical protein